WIDIASAPVLQLDLEIRPGGARNLDELVGAERSDRFALPAGAGVDRRPRRFYLEPGAGRLHHGLDLGCPGMMAPAPADLLLMMDRSGRGGGFRRRCDFRGRG